MAMTNSRPKRKTSGGRYHAYKKKRVFETRNAPSLTKLDERKVVETRSMGGARKQHLLSVNKVNVYNPKTKKYQAASVKTIVENPANRHFVRRNIMTKGAIVETELGKAKVTSRPGQEGAVNAVLL
ncbi:30S ribosomal protein S8e [Candidatus Woesearchaeota archaeon]|nr:30S ribosomal protein S8e [Candidatus Woesearchaeota archaeon]